MNGDYFPPPVRPYSPLIINAALTGMVGRRERVPHLPVTTEEIIADGLECVAAGATILHIHARRSDGTPEWSRAGYEPIIRELRARCPGVVVCVSTSGRTHAELERRADVLALLGAARPDMASLTLGSLNFRDGPSITSIESVRSLAGRMREAGIRPELEVFDSGMAHLAHQLLADETLEEPLYANLLLGAVNTAPATAGSLVHLVDAIPARTVWAAAGIGAFQLPMNALAIFIGGHVRTGLEDNPWFDYATKAPATNARLVSRVAGLASTAGRSLATFDQTREMLGLRMPATSPQDPVTRCRTVIS